MDNRLPRYEVNDADLKDGVDVVREMLEGKAPTNRFEYGLKIAAEWTREAAGGSLDDMAIRRLELATTRMTVRDAPPDEAPHMGSLDYARMLVVDVAIQEEAEHCLQLDILDRNDHYSWANISAHEGSPWAQTGTPPSRFTEFAEDDLIDLAAGRFEDISRVQREGVEVMMLRAATPRGPNLDAELMFTAAKLNGVAPEDLEVYVEPTDIGALRRNFDHYDVAEFGAVNPHMFPSRVEYADYIDRIDLANIADHMRGRQGRALYDGRPGMDPFSIAPEREGVAKDTVMAALNGHIRNPMERAARVALEWQQMEGVPLDRQATRRIEKAVGRFISHQQPQGMSDIEIAKTLIVDSGLQALASEKLAHGNIEDRRDWYEEQRSKTAEMLDKIVGAGETPGFTLMRREREETEAIASGRFESLGDHNGLASAVRTTMHRAGRYAGEEVEKDLERIAQTSRVGRAQDGDWIERNARLLSARERDRASTGAARMQSLTRGPRANDLPPSQDRSLGR